MNEDNKEKDVYQINVSAKGFEEIEDLKEKLNLKNNEDVVNLSLSILLWATSKAQNGEMISSINQDAQVTKVNIQDLENFRLRTIAAQQNKNSENNA